MIDESVSTSEQNLTRQADIEKMAVDNGFYMALLKKSLKDITTSDSFFNRPVTYIRSLERLI
ncbi:hypothetical protein BJP41_02065 [Candidatus Williamhamiltonella defendens]|uniref:Uncharacterized protein n=1 Tax=Candidatus Williamhamiltonella defendens TaxID=138072 RepID=A0A2D3T6G9_9ENTR|nr:hypothetical protein [Candidatus Hamiltonella defensa]ASV33685.1 hypothetical protein CJJ18_06295 [Candidatus Hamiltonella defensa]ATW29326.1 hypothetical protein BJP41_02065 [Candidatus Hamiltonella defensa]ATW31303.1 hypothetical protein BJP42_02125 [Candidatus Hamiltonella defensa]AWK16643.1 hypothetical protein CCS40_06135 [Candidatus Hamiltonella defensa]